MQREIEESAFRWQQEVERGERVIVGVNRFADATSRERVELHRLDPAIERAPASSGRRAVRARARRRRREAALAEVRRVARRPTPTCSRRCARRSRARCTIGEICGALRELWGTYDASAP